MNNTSNFYNPKGAINRPSVATKRATFKAVVAQLKKETTFHDGLLFDLSPRSNGLSVYFDCVCGEKLKISDHNLTFQPADIVIGDYDFDQLFEEMKEIINNHQGDCVFGKPAEIKVKKSKIACECVNCQLKFNKMLEKNAFKSAHFYFCKKCLKKANCLSSGGAEWLGKIGEKTFKLN